MAYYSCKMNIKDFKRSTTQFQRQLLLSQFVLIPPKRIINLSDLMGNADMASNHHLMANHNKLVLDFIQKPILFNVEDISFPLFTSGIRIVDSSGRRVKLAGGNWSGGHLCRQCVDGLQMRPMKDIAHDIRYKLKMNCVRLPYSLQLFFYNKVVEDKYLTANPELKGKTALQIFDITVKTLTDVGLMVILNNHTSTSMWCCSNDDGDGLWWTHEFPQYKFFNCCEEFAKRYKDNPRVIGIDLRNEIRKANGMEGTWGDENPLTDWHRAAKISGEKVLKIAPHWLIFVGGLNYQLDLTGVMKVPLEYSVKNKLVYSGHFYGFSWPVPSWALVTYDSFRKKMFNTQTYVRGLGFPFLLGEFGNNQRDIPWNYLVRYLKETDIDWTYWALDGFKCDPDKDETYGVFTNDFKNIRHPDMLADMISVGPPAGTVIGKQLQNHHSTTRSEIRETKKEEKQETHKAVSNIKQTEKDHNIKQRNKSQQKKIKVQINNQKKPQIKHDQKQENKQEEKGQTKKQVKTNGQIKTQVKVVSQQINPTEQAQTIEKQRKSKATAQQLLKGLMQFKVENKDNQLETSQGTDLTRRPAKHVIFEEKYKNH